MKIYNCPDCSRTDSCDGCFRVAYTPSNSNYNATYGFLNTPCKNCSNNPKNGGSGVCHCILGSQVIY